MSSYVINFPYTSATISSVSAVTGSQTVLAADDNRAKFILMLSGTVPAYVAFAATATTGSSYSFYMNPGDIKEEANYKGIVTVAFPTGSLSTVLQATTITK